ncbi:hypothetical protein [Notoacmeibacter ruber]|nr:hypothetical protein [Notoacmeibacter ruber]
MPDDLRATFQEAKARRRAERGLHRPLEETSEKTLPDDGAISLSGETETSADNREAGRSTRRPERREDQRAAIAETVYADRSQRGPPASAVEAAATEAEHPETETASPGAVANGIWKTGTILALCALLGIALGVALAMTVLET